MEYQVQSTKKRSGRGVLFSWIFLFVCSCGGIDETVKKISEKISCSFNVDDVKGNYTHTCEDGSIGRFSFQGDGLAIYDFKDSQGGWYNTGDTAVWKLDDSCKIVFENSIHVAGCGENKNEFNVYSLDIKDGDLLNGKIRYTRIK
jgi:hypothetical protein